MIRPHPEPVTSEPLDVMPIKILKAPQVIPVQLGLKNTALNELPPASLAMLHLLTAHQPTGLFPSPQCFKVFCAFGTLHQVFFTPGKLFLRSSPSRFLPVI